MPSDSATGNNEAPDVAVSLCPRCKRTVSDEATRCPECGAYFPAMRHRQGNILGGAKCGLFRGIGMLAFLMTMLSVASLFFPPWNAGTFLGLVLGPPVAVACHFIVKNSHRQTYQVED